MANIYKPNSGYPAQPVGPPPSNAVAYPFGPASGEPQVSNSYGYQPGYNFQEDGNQPLSPYSQSNTGGPVSFYPPGHPSSAQTYPSSDPPAYTAAVNYPTPGNPPVGSAYPPAGAAYPPAGSAYPPAGAAYPPAGLAYPPAGSAYPPAGSAYPPAGPAYPLVSGYSDGQGYNGVIYKPSDPLFPPASLDGMQGSSQMMVIMDEPNSFSDKNIRHAFIKKVYLILLSQLIITVSFVAVFLFCDSIRNWVHRNQWFYWLSYVVFLVTYILLACPCYQEIRRKWPGNFICLGIFTFAMSCMTGAISSMYRTDVVLISLTLTAVVCLAISLFAMQTKIDFTLCSGFIFVFAVIFVLFGIGCMITVAVFGPSYILHCVYGGVAALLFSLFLVYDTQMVIGGKKHKYQLSPEEYIFGAMQLYLDIANLFLITISLFTVFNTRMTIGRKKCIYQCKYQLSPEEYIYGAIQLYLDLASFFLYLLYLLLYAKRKK